MSTLVAFIYLLALVVWVGGIIFFSFFTAPSLFHALPPEYASKAVAGIFPKYYPLGYLSGVIALTCLFFAGFKGGHWHLLKILFVLIMFGLTVYTSVAIYPKARSLKEEIQTETGKTSTEALQEAFDHTHRISVIHNGIVLVLGLIVIYLTARDLSF